MRKKDNIARKLENASNQGKRAQREDKTRNKSTWKVKKVIMW